MLLSLKMNMAIDCFGRKLNKKLLHNEIYSYCFILILAIGNINAQNYEDIYCRQYKKAIEYIKKDTQLYTVFKTDAIAFNVNDAIGVGGIDPIFFEELVSYIFHKPFDSIERKLIDSTYECIKDFKSLKDSVANCFSIKRSNGFDLCFHRENETLFGATVNAHYEKKNPRNKTSPNQYLYYLFIMNKQNDIEAVFKRPLKNGY